MKVSVRRAALAALIAAAVAVRLMPTRTRKAVRHAARVRAAFVRGRYHRVVHRLFPPEPPELDDVELAHKVETMLFRDPTVPKGRISINAERGVVFLRGEIPEDDLIRDLEAAVRHIPGVQDVENLLHLPGTPAPHPA